MKLGETLVTVRVHGPKGDGDIEMLADTGATLSKIPEAFARRLGIVPSGSVEVQLADGSQKTRALAQADIEINGDRATVRILIGADNEQPLLGLTSLETLGLKVDTVMRRLEPSRFIEYFAR